MKSAPLRLRRWWPLAAVLLLALVAEGLVILLAPIGVQAQRRAEAYGFLSLAALLLLLLTRRFPKLAPYRRTFGLASLAYALLHTQLTVQHVFQNDPLNFLFLNRWTQAGIALGTAAVLGLVPLALTSFAAAQRRMGKGWKRLHRLAPLITVFAALHSAWSGVHFGLQPISSAAVILLALSAALLIIRFYAVRAKTHS